MKVHTASSVLKPVNSVTWGKIWNSINDTLVIQHKVAEYKRMYTSWLGFSKVYRTGLTVFLMRVAELVLRKPHSVCSSYFMGYLLASESIVKHKVCTNYQRCSNISSARGNERRGNMLTTGESGEEGRAESYLPYLSTLWWQLLLLQHGLCDRYGNI